MHNVPDYSVTVSFH